jgi:DNA-binding CsgD family transcriptional regulator
MHSSHSPLTPREREILKLLKQGYSDKRIAAMLQRSAHTVHRHVESIFKKLGVHSRRDLMRPRLRSASRCAT